MKKINCFIATLLCLVSCNNQTELSMEVPVEKKSNFETFAIYGEVHNSLLQYVSENFTEPEVDPDSLDEALDYVLEIQRKGVNELSISSREKAIISEHLELYKKFYVTENVMEVVQPTQTKSLEQDDEDVTTEDIKALIQEAYDLGGIDEFEYQTFMQLIDCVVANAEGSLSNSEFEVKVTDLISQWEVKYADVDFSALEIESDNSNLQSSDDIVIAFSDVPQGALSGVVLSVSKSSLEYWEEEQPATKAVPAFVGPDIAGALIGATTSIIGQYVINDSLSWESVAWDAAIGAVSCSTSVVGNLGKWFNKLLKPKKPKP